MHRNNSPFSPPVPHIHKHELSDAYCRVLASFTCVKVEVAVMVSVDVKQHSASQPAIPWAGLAWRQGVTEADKQRDLGSNPLRLSFLVNSSGLWTLSCDFVPHN